MFYQTIGKSDERTLVFKALEDKQPIDLSVFSGVRFYIEGGSYYVGSIEADQTVEGGKRGWFYLACDSTNFAGAVGKTSCTVVFLSGGNDEYWDRGIIECLESYK